MKRAVAKDWLRDDAGYEAVFRFSVVSKVEALISGGERLPDAVRTVAEMRHLTRPGRRGDGERTQRVSLDRGPP
jgi:hypothetical protein